MSLEVFPLVDRADNCYTTSLYFLFLLFFCLFNLEFQNLLLSVPSVLSCVLFCSLSIPSTLFYSSSYSLFCFLPLCLFNLFSDVPYCFFFKSVILSFLFSYCSVLSASPLCSITIQSVLFLLVFIFLDPSI